MLSRTLADSYNVSNVGHFQYPVMAMWVQFRTNYAIEGVQSGDSRGSLSG